jgi:anti-sigma factor RsiW
MSMHLTEEQFSMQVSGEASTAVREHLAQCAKCRDEVEAFSSAMALFRSVVHESAEARVNTGESGASRESPPAEVAVGKWKWMWVAASALTLVLLPFVMREGGRAPVTEDAAVELHPDVLMDTVNMHLSRTLPAPLEPILALLPADESAVESGESR